MAALTPSREREEQEQSRSAPKSSFSSRCTTALGKAHIVYFHCTRARYPRQIVPATIPTSLAHQPISIPPLPTHARSTSTSTRPGILFSSQPARGLSTLTFAFIFTTSPVLSSSHPHPSTVGAVFTSERSPPRLSHVNSTNSNSNSNSTTGILTTGTIRHHRLDSQLRRDTRRPKTEDC
ncbi:hypothetical protein DL98DRAFT_589699 [Cadophora sp. DSE1049]|nr:hypothetical protein DL98DRAFT_589699 [Cadophora sp. DSE1049]